MVYATHLHELGFAVDEINRSIDGVSKVISMVALVKNQKHEKQNENKVIRTFKIVKSPPEDRSYALEIATKYGISFQQLKKLFTELGVINGD